MAVRTIIESLGVYLPERVVTTEEVVRGCKRANKFPLERMTGIRNRRVAGNGEFATELAEQAVARCLAISRHEAEDIDLVISACVGRSDGEGLWVVHEPSMAIELIRRRGFKGAVGFDIVNACASMFTGIALADTLIRRAIYRRVVVVSGEYISHLGTTAQHEIDGMLDPRMACLTLGDAGAAVLLEANEADDCGFAALELMTLGAFSRYCVGHPTHGDHGGGIMFTDAMKLTDVGTRAGAVHAIDTLARAQWDDTTIDYLVMHQTSSTALQGAAREINRRARRMACPPHKLVNNLAERGNTASTTHFVALADGISSGQFKPGNRLALAISGSGLTVGTGLYKLDDLPTRMKGECSVATKPEFERAPAKSTPVPVESVSTFVKPADEPRDSLAMLGQVANSCLSKVNRPRDSLSLLINVGVYRNDFVVEPAQAALLAGDLEINSNLEAVDGQRTLAFDILNGALGFLNACYLACEMIRDGQAETAMIVTAEIENNADQFSSDVIGLEEAAGALILSRGDQQTGFGAFLFRAFPEHTDAFASRAIRREGKNYLSWVKSTDADDIYLKAMTATALALLADEGLRLEDIAIFIPPQISEDFILRLAERLGANSDLFVRAMPGDRDLTSASIPFALGSVIEKGGCHPGQIGLVMAVGSGVQAGCALYHF